MKSFKSTAFISIFLVFIAVMSVTNIPLVMDPIKRLAAKETDFTGFVSEVKENYLSDFNQKNMYVNINGLFAKMTGRKVYNEVAILENGMLINEALNERDLSSSTEKLAEFSNYIKQTGREYLYVEAPYKMDLENTLRPIGVENHANEIANDVLEKLDKLNVDTLDLRPLVSKTPEMVEQNFYVTDHHWNVNGSFIGFTEITKKICEYFPNIEVPYYYLDKANWNSTVYEDFFLGSLGKRVGKYFAGVDDVTYLTPKFDTEISTYIVNHKTFKKGDFVDANMNLKYFEDEPKYFEDNTYCMYLGGDYPLVMHRNSKAPIDLKILLLKDSFSIPVQAYLSTVFSEIDVIDPRYYNTTTIAEYVEACNPNIVITMMNPSVSTSENYYSMGSDTIDKIVEATDAVTDVDATDKQIIANDNDYAYTTVATVAPNSKYTFSLEDIIVEKGDSEAVTVALYDTENKTIVTSCALDIEYCKAKKSFEYSFVTSYEKEMELLVYAGLHGKTKGNTVTLKGANLVRYK